MTDTNRWAVSNVGYFSGSNNPPQTSISSSNITIFTNAYESELLQTARLSASSLRYYGLGLQNGNYTVTLQFAETAFADTKTWKSLGKRVFDVYIQVWIILLTCFRSSAFLQRSFYGLVIFFTPVFK